MGNAWLTGFAADDAIGARAIMTISSTVISCCVLRKLAADFLADAFDLLGRVLTEGHVASGRRDVETKNAN